MAIQAPENEGHLAEQSRDAAAENLAVWATPVAPVRLAGAPRAICSRRHHPMLRSSRRDFLKNTGVAGAAVTPGKCTLCPAHAAEASPVGGARPAIPPAPSWVNKPMCWAQLTLVKDDPGTFDLTFWLDYFACTKSDAVCLSGGGCVA